MSDLTFLAIHLPQFHPIPENDLWWGKGFTEWTNVVNARPLFRGHYQPHLPADLGFYDLRLPEARQAQADFAHRYGIDGFCYFHYWFHGRRLLERPVNEILASGSPDFPFCLYWANETWEGRWHGLVNEKKILIRQEYSKADDLNHIRWLAQAMADPRYIKVKGRPLFVIYRPYDLPDCRRTLELWREEMVRLGLPNPYFVASNSHAFKSNPLNLGFDAVFQSLPQLGLLDYSTRIKDRKRWHRFIRNVRKEFHSTKPHVYDYETSVRKMLIETEWPVIRSLFPGWDNTPRAGKRGVVFQNNTPDVFERLLSELAERTLLEREEGERLMFLNAWNEWAEGNHLEPDQRYGCAYLEAVLRVKNKLNGGMPPDLAKILIQ